MIKEGDKVLCIKNFNNNSQKFIVGNFYEVLHFSKNTRKQIDQHYQQIYIKGEISNNYGGGFWFYSNFDDFFITMAEYREQQMKSILE